VVTGVLSGAQTDCIDILESRLFDVEQEAVRCSKVKMPSVLSEFKATKKTSGGGKAVWSAKSGNEFVADPNGDVGVLTGGTYVAALQTPHSTSSHEENIILVRGGKRMLLKTILHNPNGSNEDDCYDYDDAYEDYDYEDRKSSTSGFTAMLFVLELRDGDLFAFKACSFRMKAGAKMVIAKLACR